MTTTKSGGDIFKCQKSGLYSKVETSHYIEISKSQGNISFPSTKFSSAQIRKCKLDYIFHGKFYYGDSVG